MRHRRSWFVPALLVAAITAVGLAPGLAVAQEEDDGRLTVGRLRLDPCEDLDGAWCGNLRVPYDRADPAAGTIPINFEWYPAEQRAGGHDRGHGGRPRLPEHGQPRLLHRAVRRPRSAPATCCWSTTAAPAPPGWSTAGRCSAGTSPSARRSSTAAWPPAATSSTAPGRCPAAASCTAATCTAPPTPPATWPTCSPPSRPGRSTCTATPTAATSARSSPPATRGCCGR